jgi:hypothetical protein
VAVIEVAVDLIRAEKVRLRGLHQQVQDFLTLMAEVVHRPWILPLVDASRDPGPAEAHAQDTHIRAAVGTEELPISSLPRPNVHRLPGHMRLAEPVSETDDPRSQARIREAVSLELHPGWRAEAFTELLAIAERRLSLQPGSLDEAVIDREPRQRRVLLEQLLAHSDGKGIQDLNLQEELGERIVRKIAEGYRDALLRAQTNQTRRYSLPPVMELTKDALANVDVRVDQMLEAMAVPEYDWDSYLCQLLKQPPELSWYELTDDAKDMLHSRVMPDSLRVYAVGPSRLRAEFDGGTGGIYESLTSEGSLPTELVIRLDQRTLSGPEHVSLFRDPRKSSRVGAGEQGGRSTGDQADDPPSPDVNY